jgi:hypothetical protein
MRRKVRHATEGNIEAIEVRWRANHEGEPRRHGLGRSSGGKGRPRVAGGSNLSNPGL